MLQLFCPACEDIVWMDETADDEPASCPTCGHGLPAAGRRKARPVHESEPIRARSPATELHVKPAAPRTKVLARGYRDDQTNEEERSREDFDVPWSEPIPRFVPLPYRPEGGVDIVRFPWFVALILGGGLFLGWLMSTIGQECYLILLFPLGAGIALAGLGLFASHVARMRNVAIGGPFAVIAAVVAVVGMHWWDSQRTEHLRIMDPHRVPAPVRERLGERSNFLTYLDATSDVGWTVSGSKEAGFNLGRGGTIAYWVAEFLIVGALAVVGVRYGAREPFCSRCRRAWKDERVIGGVRDSGELGKLLQRGNLAGLVECRPNTRDGDVALTIAVCPHCGSEAPIDIMAERIRGAGKMGVMAHYTYPGEALPVVESVFG